MNGRKRSGEVTEVYSNLKCTLKELGLNGETIALTCTLNGAVLLSSFNHLLIMGIV